MILASPFRNEFRETKVTFSNSKVEKCSRKVPTHMLRHELEELVANGNTILKIKDL